MREDIPRKSRHVTKAIGRMGKGRAEASSLLDGQCCSFPLLCVGGKLGISDLEGSKPAKIDMEKQKTINFLSLEKLAKTSYSRFVADFLYLCY